MNDKKKKDEGEERFDRTVITSIEKIEGDTDQRAYILFLSGPLQGKLFCLDQDQTVVGRSDDVDIPIRDTRISRHHFQITIEGGSAVIEDLGSTNGTFVNGKRVKRRTLENGDKVQISSSTIFKFAYGDKGERMFHEEFYQMANFDIVTGVPNKQVFTKRLKEEFSYAKRNRWPLSLLMIDIDFFKKVNDTYGHMAGDHVLHGVAQRIHETIRSEDIIARYGGEEFAVVLRGIEEEGAVQLAERIRNVIAAKPYEFEKHTIPVTISIGVATLADDNFKEPKQLITKADQHLYASKENGRNRVTSDHHPT